MKKRILLSLVSFFMMTAMWASLQEAYKIYVTADANGKTGDFATLTLNMKNRNAITKWQCTLVLPAGVTFESAELVPNRYPSDYNAHFVATPNEDGTVDFLCESGDDVALLQNDGAIATVKVKIASTVEPGDFAVTIKGGALMIEPNDEGHERKDPTEFTWTIEQGAPQYQVGDVNGDGSVDIADAVAVLKATAGNPVLGDADVNGDGTVDIADAVAVLKITAGNN
jgi:hypothetical protein